MQFDLLADGIAATSARAALGFLAALALFKTAKKRFMRGGTPLDTLLIVIVGAVLGRGVAWSRASTSTARWPAAWCSF